MVLRWTRFVEQKYSAKTQKNLWLVLRLPNSSQSNKINITFKTSKNFSVTPRRHNCDTEMTVSRYKQIAWWVERLGKILFEALKKQ